MAEFCQLLIMEKENVDDVDASDEDSPAFAAGVIPLPDMLRPPPGEQYGEQVASKPLHRKNSWNKQVKVSNYMFDQSRFSDLMPSQSSIKFMKQVLDFKGTWDLNNRVQLLLTIGCHWPRLLVEARKQQTQERKQDLRVKSSKRRAIKEREARKSETPAKRQMRIAHRKKVDAKRQAKKSKEAVHGQRSKEELKRKEFDPAEDRDFVDVVDLKRAPGSGFGGGGPSGSAGSSGSVAAH